MSAPERLARLNLPKFKEWLLAHGAQVFEPTNPYEVLRIRTGNGTHVLYTKENGILTWPDELVRAYQGFKGNREWRAVPPTKRRRNSASPVLKTLFKRDGEACFFCGQQLTFETATIEHLVPAVHGGPNHLSNYVAACQPCNLTAGHLSAMEKIRMREKMRINLVQVA